MRNIDTTERDGIMVTTFSMANEINTVYCLRKKYILTPTATLKVKEQMQKHTFRRNSKWESISQSENQQFDEVIKLQVDLYDNTPSISPRSNDLLVQASGEGSSSGIREFIIFCSNTRQLKSTKKQQLENDMMVSNNIHKRVIRRLP